MTPVTMTHESPTELALTTLGDVTQTEKIPSVLYIEIGLEQAPFVFILFYFFPHLNM